MSNYKKIYTIEVTNSPNSGIWYANKVGYQYKAELKAKNSIPFFEVNPCQFIPPLNCKIISEELVEKYSKQY